LKIIRLTDRRYGLRNYAAVYPVVRVKALEWIDFEGLRTRIAESKQANLKRAPTPGIMAVIRVKTQNVTSWNML
jgi:hypothetical protein